MTDMPFMPFLLGAVAALVGIVLAYRTIRPWTRRRRQYDAGAVSDYWLQQQRGQSDDRPH
jgi:hypothetical protein